MNSRDFTFDEEALSGEVVAQIVALHHGNMPDFSIPHFPRDFDAHKEYPGALGFVMAQIRDRVKILYNGQNPHDTVTSIFFQTRQMKSMVSAVFTTLKLAPIPRSDGSFYESFFLPDDFGTTAPKELPIPLDLETLAIDASLLRSQRYEKLLEFCAAQYHQPGFLFLAIDYLNHHIGALSKHIPRMPSPHKTKVTDGMNGVYDWENTQRNQPFLDTFVLSDAENKLALFLPTFFTVDHSYLFDFHFTPLQNVPEDEVPHKVFSYEVVQMYRTMVERKMLTYYYTMSCYYNGLFSDENNRAEWDAILLTLKKEILHYQKWINEHTGKKMNNG